MGLIQTMKKAAKIVAVSWNSFINPTNRHQGAIVVNKINVRPIQRESQDIQKWRNAMIMAEGVGQQRLKLYDLYEDIMIDGFLQSIVDKRVRAITNRELVFTIDGKEIEDVTGLTDKTFFEDFAREIMLSRMYGHSLIELNWPAPNSETKGWSKLVNRKHVKPRYGIVTPNAWDMEGYAYREKPFDMNCIEAGGDETLGLLLQAAQYVIYKRGNFGDWAEYAEVFGMPFRWATYNNEQTRLVLEGALETAGSAGYVVAPEDANLQFLNGNATGNGSDVFRFLRMACNEEMAILILGNTMTTTEAKSSGYAQGLVHESVQEEMHKDDRRFFLRILNERLTPYLKALGYQVDGGKWAFVDPDPVTLQDRIKIDLQVASQVPIPASYWYEKYSIPMPTADDPPHMPEEDPEESKTAKPGESKSDTTDEEE